MNPDRQPLALDVQRVEWVPVSPDELSVRVFGAWRGATVPPEVVLVAGSARCPADPGEAPAAGPPPAWAAAFRAPIEARALLEGGEGAFLEADGAAVALPAALPGRLTSADEGPGDDAGGTLVDPAVLAERRARRAEVAEQSASERAATAEQTVDTLRTQLEHLEERLARAGAERDALAARVGDAERRLRLAEQREEAERRRRSELEEEALAARRTAEAEVQELRDRLAGAEEVAGSIEQELRRARRRQEEAVRGRAETEAALAEAQARIDTLERGAGAGEGAREESEALRRHAADLERRLAEASAAHESSPEADALRARLAAAETELARRTQDQADVQATIAAVREELGRVRAAVEAGREGGPLRAELVALDERRRALEAALQARDAALVEARDVVEHARSATAQARSDADEQRAALAAAQRVLGDLQDRLGVERRAREAAEAALADARSGVARRAELEARVRALAGEVAAIRLRLAQATADAERRLAERPEPDDVDDDERPGDGPDVSPDTGPDAVPETGPDAVPEDPAAPAEAASTGDDALDALIAGLRAQVTTAREQLETWDIDAPAPAPAPAPADAPPAVEPRVEAAAPEPATAAPPPPEPALAPAIDETTRLRLQAIEDELRAAVPDPSVPTPARDVIASLQRAADRLRTAAEDELERLDQPASAAPAPPPPATPPAHGPVTLERAVPVPLGARPLRPRSPERPWLRSGVERLAASDPDLASDLLLALLPAQALTGSRLTYVLAAAPFGTVRVTLTGDAARVERPGERAPEADGRVEGDLAAIAPLVTGGGGWRLRGARVTGGHRYKLRRLAWARRRPLGLTELLRVSPPPDPRLLLAGLAAAVDPAWTAGERFGVAYAFAGNGRWAVVADDGAPLTVIRDDPLRPRDALVSAGPEALLALLAGTTPAGHRPAELTGDRRAAELLHAWFDRARGVAPR